MNPQFPNPTFWKAMSLLTDFRPAARRCAAALLVSAAVVGSAAAAGPAPVAGSDAAQATEVAAKKTTTKTSGRKIT